LGRGGAASRAPFFYSRDLDEPERLVLDCYRLAKYYGRNPREFLDMPCSEVLRHVMWTVKLQQKIRPLEDGDE
jgi:hypothetical protein